MPLVSPHHAWRERDSGQDFEVLNLKAKLQVRVSVELNPNRLVLSGPICVAQLECLGHL